MRDPELRLPYHDSISLCTAPTATTTTVEWQPDASEDVYVIGDEEVDGRAAERIDMVVEHVRELAGVDAAVRLESENSFPSNIGFGSSSSGFAAAALQAHRGRWPRPHFTGYLHRRPSRLLLRGPFGDRRVLPAGSTPGSTTRTAARTDSTWAWATTASTRKRTSGSSPLTSRLIRRRKRRTARPPRAT